MNMSSVTLALYCYNLGICPGSRNTFANLLVYFGLPWIQKLYNKSILGCQRSSYTLIYLSWIQNLLLTSFWAVLDPRIPSKPSKHCPGSKKTLKRLSYIQKRLKKPIWSALDQEYLLEVPFGLSWTLRFEALYKTHRTTLKNNHFVNTDQIPNSPTSHESVKT